MKPIKRIHLLHAFAMVTAAIFLASCHAGKNNKPKNSDAYYTCSMHPQVHEDKPGNCPICGMKLIKVEKSNSKDSTSLDTLLNYLTQPVTQTAVGSFSVITPVKENTKDTIDADGVIGFDQRNINHIAARVTGRIEKLYVQYAGQAIYAGQPLAEIYSPQLVSAQRDLLQTIRDNDTVLENGLKAKLLNLGMYESEIQKVIQNKKPLTEFTVFSPYEGIAIQNNTQDISSSMEALSPKEGMYVHTGQTLFSLQNLNSKWAMLQIFSNDINHVHTGDKVELSADAAPDKIVLGQINFIPPYREDNEQTTSVRVYLKDLPADWKIGTLVHGKIMISKNSNGTYVPLTAVNLLGKRNMVWVKDKKYPHIFHVRLVTTGAETGNAIQIISGINPGEQIAENAEYMTGSDSFIQ